MKLLFATAALLAALGLAPVAAADPPTPHAGDPNLCASNPAYHNMHDGDNKQKYCQKVSLNDFGGNGAAFGDRDGDGVLNGDDADTNDPNVH